MDTRKYALAMLNESRDKISQTVHYDIDEIQAICKECPDLMFEEFAFKDMNGNVTIKGDLVAYAVYMQNENLLCILNDLTRSSETLCSKFIESASKQIQRETNAFFPLNPFFSACKKLEEAKNNRQSLDEHVETVINTFKQIPKCIISFSNDLKPLSWKQNINLFMLEVSKTYNNLEAAVKYPQDVILNRINHVRSGMGLDDISLNKTAKQADDAAGVVDIKGRVALNN